MTRIFEVYCEGPARNSHERVVLKRFGIDVLDVDGRPSYFIAPLGSMGSWPRLRGDVRLTDYGQRPNSELIAEEAELGEPRTRWSWRCDQCGAKARPRWERLQVVIETLARVGESDVSLRGLSGIL